MNAKLLYKPSLAVLIDVEANSQENGEAIHLFTIPFRWRVHKSLLIGL